MEDIFALSDTQIQKRIGEKVKNSRLRQNITQSSLAKAAVLSLSSVKKIESGDICSFDSLLRVLRILGMLDRLSSLIEEDGLSPNEYFAMVTSARKHERKRAAGKVKQPVKEESEW